MNDFNKTPTTTAAAVKVLLAIMIIFAVVGAAPVFARTPLEKTLKAQGRILPNTIDFESFVNAAFDEGMVEIEGILAENEVPILGEDDRRYIRRKDLLRLCGKDCSYDTGWGIFLSQFSVQVHRK